MYLDKFGVQVPVRLVTTFGSRQVYCNSFTTEQYMRLLAHTKTEIAKLAQRVLGLEVAQDVSVLSPYLLKGDVLLNVNGRWHMLSLEGNAVTWYDTEETDSLSLLKCLGKLIEKRLRGSLTSDEEPLSILVSISEYLLRQKQPPLGPRPTKSSANLETRMKALLMKLKKGTVDNHTNRFVEGDDWLPYYLLYNFGSPDVVFKLKYSLDKKKRGLGDKLLTADC